MFSMFREKGKGDKPGPVSMRRVLAFALAIAAVSLFVLGLFILKTGSGLGWVVFLPGFASLASSILFLFFTTWGDVKDLVSAVKGKT